MYREDGYYWITIGSEAPTVAHYQADWDCWWVSGNDAEVSPDNVIVISDRIPEPKEPTP